MRLRQLIRDIVTGLVDDQDQVALAVSRATDAGLPPMRERGGQNSPASTESTATIPTGGTSAPARPGSPTPGSNGSPPRSAGPAAGYAVQNDEFRPPTIVWSPMPMPALKSSQWPDVTVAPAPRSRTGSTGSTKSGSMIELKTFCLRMLA